MVATGKTSAKTKLRSVIVKVLKTKVRKNIKITYLGRGALDCKEQGLRFAHEHAGNNEVERQCSVVLAIKEKRLQPKFPRPTKSFQFGI